MRTQPTNYICDGLIKFHDIIAIKTESMWNRATNHVLLTRRNTRHSRTPLVCTKRAFRVVGGSVRRWFVFNRSSYLPIWTRVIEKQISYRACLSTILVWIALIGWMKWIYAEQYGVNYLSYSKIKWSWFHSRTAARLLYFKFNFKLMLKCTIIYNKLTFLFHLEKLFIYFSKFPVSLCTFP